jgi:DNA-binding NarL/FixJ family response regulator
MINLVIIEDDLDFRDGLQHYLRAQPAFSCDWVAGSMEEFFEQLQTAKPPEVILMDSGLPGMSGVSGMPLLKEKYPAINIILLMVYHDAHKVFDALCAGASAYLLKNAPLAEIKATIELAYAGGAFMSPPIARKALDHFAKAKSLQPPLALTALEQEIAGSIVAGLNHNAIAARLNIAPETVPRQIKNIYVKLHASHVKAK